MQAADKRIQKLMFTINYRFKSCAIPFTAFCDTWASVNVVPITFSKRLGFTHAMKSLTGSIQLADQSNINPLGEVHDVLAKIKGVILVANYVAIGTNEVPRMEIISGRPFIATVGAKLDFKYNIIILKENCV